MSKELYVLHKNDKGEWGMWREYYKKGTAIYWQAASEEQLYYLETNYRSTKQIIDFCQNIVTKNHSQYNYKGRKKISRRTMV